MYLLKRETVLESVKKINYNLFLFLSNMFIGEDNLVLVKAKNAPVKLVDEFVEEYVSGTPILTLTNIGINSDVHIRLSPMSCLESPNFVVVTGDKVDFWILNFEFWKELLDNCPIEEDVTDFVSPVDLSC